jgi:hypothetical protein
MYASGIGGQGCPQFGQAFVLTDPENVPAAVCTFHRGIIILCPVDAVRKGIPRREREMADVRIL